MCPLWEISTSVLPRIFREAGACKEKGGKSDLLEVGSGQGGLGLAQPHPASGRPMSR
jgi:hypothetical protein